MPDKYNLERWLKSRFDQIMEDSKMPEWRAPGHSSTKDRFIELEICSIPYDRSQGSGKLITFRVSDLVAVSGSEDSSKPGRIHLRSGSRYDVTNQYQELVEIKTRQQQNDV